MVESNHFKKPLLRWAGGKWHLLKILIENIPDNVKNHIYIEPFLGAGSLFFYLQPESAIISDANSHLIKFYENLRDYPLEICNHLIFLKDQSNKDFYYKIRDIYNNSDFSPKQAARFLYLNRTCFNAIFRVNKKDKFNVPYGWKEPPSIPSKNQLIQAGKILNNAIIKACGFDQALQNINNNSFIYLDPPYPPLNGTSFFTQYTPDGFNDKDQIRLASILAELDRVGVQFMMSNANTSLIRSLYKNFIIKEVSVVRYVTSKKIKHKVSELIIKNYSK